MMDADDETLHLQLHHLVHQARKATNCDTATLITSFHDDVKDAKATLAVFSHEEESDSTNQEMMSNIVEATLRGLSNMVREHSDLEVLLRDKKTGEEYDLAGGSYGHHVTESKL